MLRNWKEEDLKPKGFTFNHNEALTFHNETKEKIARAKMSLIESLDNQSEDEDKKGNQITNMAEKIKSHLGCINDSQKTGKNYT